MQDATTTRAPVADGGPPVATAGVVGAGVMGRDVAALLANAGVDVVLVDVDEAALATAESYLADDAPAALVDAGLAETPPGIAPRVTTASDLAALADAGFVVEAITEDLDAKRGLVADLEAVVDADAVLGTNTSSLTAREVGGEAVHPERVVLFHFANPALPRDVVEIAGEDAADWALDRAEAVACAIGKHPVRLRRERRGNGLSRMSAAIKCAGTWELLEAEPAAIARGARAMGFPRGPLEFVDVIGVDIHLATVDNLAVEYGDRFAPPPEVRERMERMVAEGHAGKKDGEGFFTWQDGGAVVPDDGPVHDVQPVVAALVNEAHRMVADGIADRDTLNDVLKRGSGGDVGPFDVESMVGADALREILRERHAETGAGVFEPAETL